MRKIKSNAVGNRIMQKVIEKLYNNGRYIENGDYDEQNVPRLQVFLYLFSLLCFIMTV